LEGSNPIEDDHLISGEELIWAQITCPSQAAGREVRVLKGNCMPITAVAAGDLAENQVVAVKRSED